MFFAKFFTRDSNSKGSSNRDPMLTRDWTELPLLPSIADNLGLIDLLRFRAVCKDWKAASSTASAEIEALPHHEPWFLLYGDNDSQCTMVTEHSTTKHTIDIPQLNGTTCLASSQGWLLLFREGSMFFFCPLSRAKIYLPGPFPHTVISDHIALFSAPPTSKDCVVGVINRTETKIELHTVRRGATRWTEHTHSCSDPKKFEFSGYHDGKFLFFDNKGSVVYVPIEEPELYIARVVVAEKFNEGIPLRFGNKDDIMKKRMGLELDLSEVSICGTNVAFEDQNGRCLKEMVPHQNNGVAKRQGVWFQPRFHQICEKQIW